MNKALGVGLLIAGIVLVIFGISASDSIGSDFSRFFTGTPTDKSMWLLIGGILAAIVGGVLTSRKSIKS